MKSKIKGKWIIIWPQPDLSLCSRSCELPFTVVVYKVTENLNPDTYQIVLQLEANINVPNTFSSFFSLDLYSNDNNDDATSTW